jgi:hypothetical protein
MLGRYANTPLVLALIPMYAEILLANVSDRVLAHLDEVNEIFAELFALPEQVGQSLLVHAICFFLNGTAKLGTDFRAFVGQFVPWLFQVAGCGIQGLEAQALETLSRIAQHLGPDDLRQIWDGRNHFAEVDPGGLMMGVATLIDRVGTDEVTAEALDFVVASLDEGPEFMVMALQLLSRILARNETYVAQVIEYLRPQFDAWMAEEEHLTRSALGVLTFLWNLLHSFRSNRYIIKFIHAYLSGALRVILTKQRLLMESEIVTFVAHMLHLVPNEDVNELYQLIQTEIDESSNLDIYGYLIFFMAKLYEKLDNEKRLTVISRMDTLVSVLLDTKNMEQFNSVLVDAMIPILKIDGAAKILDDMSLVQLGYRWVLTMHEMINSNHLLAPTFFEFIGRMAKFECEDRQRVIKVVLEEVNGGPHPIFALEALTNFLKSGAIDSGVVFDVVSALTPEVDSDEAKFMVASCFALLLSQGHRDSLEFVVANLDLFFQWLRDTTSEDHDMVAAMLLHLADVFVEMDAESVKRLIREFPFRFAGRTTRRVAPVLLRIVQRSEGFHEDVFVALLNFFSSGPFEKTSMFRVAEEVVVQMEDCFLQLSAECQIENCYPEFMTLVAHEAVRLTRIQTALASAQARAAAPAAEAPTE